MNTLYLEVPNINTILLLYNQIQVIKYTGDDDIPSTPVGEVEDMSDWTVVSGVAPYTTPIDLSLNQTMYYVYDYLGGEFDWYSYRYVLSSQPSDINSGWSYPILNTNHSLYYNPLYPNEVEVRGQDKMLINRIRTLIGDRVELKRDAGEEYEINLHPDGRVYELTEKGWPVSVTVGGTQYNSNTNPVVNGYKYLKFNSDVSTFTTVSGVDYNIDIWYYTFRYSDKEILSAYDLTPPPFGLTSTTATSEAYILATAIDLVRSELFLDSTESGAEFSDNYTSFSPDPGLTNRRNLLDDLKKQLDKVVTSLKLKGISGVRID